MQEGSRLQLHLPPCPREAAWPLNMAVRVALGALPCIASHGATPALQHYQWWRSMLAIATPRLAIGHSPGSLVVWTLPIGPLPRAQSLAGTSTNQRSESCASHPTRSSGACRLSCSCPAPSCPSVVRILAATVGMEGERLKQAHIRQGYIPYYAAALVEGEGTDDLPVSLMHPAVGTNLTLR